MSLQGVYLVEELRKNKIEVEYIYDDYTLRQSMEKMEYHRYTSIPIINKNGEYIGTITEGDLLWEVKHWLETNNEEFNLKSLENIKIKDIKKYNKNEAISINSDMESLINLAVNQNFVPVVDDQNIFIGIIKRSDIISYYHEKMKTNYKMII